MTYAGDDLELVRAFRKGDERAFEELVRRYQRQVANVIYLTLGSRAEVDDLTQEVFLRVYRSLSRVEVTTSLFSWIYRIAVNIAIDELRRRKIKRTLSLDFFSESSLEREKNIEDPTEPSERVLSDERKQKVMEAIKKLTPAHRAALVLREYEGLSYKEIAQTLNITEQAVKSRIFRSREELKKLLGDYFKE